MATTAALAQISNLAARYTSANYSRVLPGQEVMKSSPPILKAAHVQPLTLWPAVSRR